MQDANNMETVSTDGDGVRGHIEHYVLSVQGSVKLYPELNLFFFPKCHRFHDSNYMTFWKGQNYSNGKKSLVAICLGVGEVEYLKHRRFREMIVKLFCIIQ